MSRRGPCPSESAGPASSVSVRCGRCWRSPSMWLAVPFAALFGPDIVSTSAGADSTTVPSASMRVRGTNYLGAGAWTTRCHCGLLPMARTLVASSVAFTMDATTTTNLRSGAGGWRVRAIDQVHRRRVAAAPPAPALRRDDGSHTPPHGDAVLSRRGAAHPDACSRTTTYPGPGVASDGGDESQS